MANNKCRRSRNLINKWLISLNGNSVIIMSTCWLPFPSHSFVGYTVLHHRTSYTCSCVPVGQLTIAPFRLTAMSFSVYDFLSAENETKWKGLLSPALRKVSVNLNQTYALYRTYVLIAHSFNSFVSREFHIRCVSLYIVNVFHFVVLHKHHRHL